MVVNAFAVGSPFTYTNNKGKITITGYTGNGGNVIIPRFIKGLPVVAIGDDSFAFKGNLTSVVIPSSVKTIGFQAFYNCTGLTNITLNHGLVTIGNQAFVFNFNLTTIKIPDTVKRIGSYAFASCYNLTGFNIPQNVTTIKDYRFLDVCNG